MVGESGRLPDAQRVALSPGQSRKEAQPSTPERTSQRQTNWCRLPGVRLESPALLPKASPGTHGNPAISTRQRANEGVRRHTCLPLLGDPRSTPLPRKHPWVALAGHESWKSPRGRASQSRWRRFWTTNSWNTSLLDQLFLPQSLSELLQIESSALPSSRTKQQNPSSRRLKLQITTEENHMRAIMRCLALGVLLSASEMLFAQVFSFQKVDVPGASATEPERHQRPRRHRRTHRRRRRKRSRVSLPSRQVQAH